MCRPKDKKLRLVCVQEAVREALEALERVKNTVAAQKIVQDTVPYRTVPYQVTNTYKSHHTRYGEASRLAYSYRTALKNLVHTKTRGDGLGG